MTRMLESVGVQPDDEAVFRALLHTPECTVAELAAGTARDQAAIRRSVARLEDLGLLSRTAHRPARLIPTRPDVAVEVLVARRQAELERARTAAVALVAQMQSPTRYRPENLVEVVVGQPAIAARYAQLQSGTERELLVLDRPPYVAEVAESDSRERQLLRSQVDVRVIYAPESLALPGGVDVALAAAEAGERSRVHPQVPIKLAVSDRSIALLPLAMDQLRGSALVVRESALVEALAQLFHLLWDQAMPLVPSTAEGRAEGGADRDVDRRLLTMLAAGLKDDAIARQLGVSSRTVGRRVAELMARLGARTRFEAGVRAQRLL
ncbi:DNA-binding response regulator, NarL/FixJ family, contains REC and HTH domains [Jiangella alkaliphila]|uniref:DNA-binding response regulator, NarL/FixJ family, contains REC and HTH domains n=2 Tax=Jiangella alkaliphila TaxID=419479 RepID=A0A1H2K1C1_9ACTN|nr:DNA-binding response regulator, NarL/FixJ family, contains REC and HTH domains [Jiangella alkaliphila]